MRSPVNYTGVLRNHMVEAPTSIEACTGIRIFGRLLRSIMFSTDVAIIANTNADAVIAVYPFTPQPRIVSAVMSAADMPVFFGVGGGFTSGERSVNQSLAAENMGAFGVVVNAPVTPDVLRRIKSAVDIPVIATIVSAEQDTDARIEAGADILNVAASTLTPAVVEQLRSRHPDIPIMATGGPTDESIRATIAAGANAITFTPPDTGVLLAQIMGGHRERFRHGD
ncbi:MAG: hydrolase [Oscillospiraceae bacterium]|nr:hydrolase [Oscillospiraceae bacterium]